MEKKEKERSNKISIVDILAFILLGSVYFVAYMCGFFNK